MTGRAQEIPLHGSVAIVTGASAGIGRATALGLAAQGANVVASARRADRLAALAGEAAQLPGAVIPAASDVAVEADRERLVRETLERFGRIDILINNAGFGYASPIETTPLQQIRANFETNLFGAVDLMQRVIPSMRQQRRGTIVNVSSVAGVIARPLSAIYDSTKHAMEAISTGIRREVSGFGIKVIVIQPGFVETEFKAVSDALSAPYFHDQPEYGALLERRRARESNLRKLAVPPQDIADLIVQAIRSPHPKPTYTAPRMARVSINLKRFLPARLFERLIGV